MYVLCQYTLTIYGFLIIENRKYHQEMEEALPPEIVDREKKNSYSYKRKMCYATYTSTTTLKSYMKRDDLGNEKYVCIVCRIKLSCNNNK